MNTQEPIDYEALIEELEDLDVHRAAVYAIKTLQAQLDEANEKLATILDWCHGNIESGSQVSGFCIQVRDLIERPIPDTDKPELARVEAEGVGDNNGFFEITQDQG